MDDKTVAICTDLKKVGLLDFRSICNPDHLQINLFSTIPNSDKSGFQILTVLNGKIVYDLIILNSTIQASVTPNLTKKKYRLPDGPGKRSSSRRR